jgi:hypothetical protein
MASVTLLAGRAELRPTQPRVRHPVDGLADAAARSDATAVYQMEPSRPHHPPAGAPKQRPLGLNVEGRLLQRSYARLPTNVEKILESSAGKGPRILRELKNAFWAVTARQAVRAMNT